MGAAISGWVMGFEEPVELTGLAEGVLDGVVEEVVVTEGEDQVAEILFQRPVEAEHVGQIVRLAVPEGVEQAAQLVALPGALREGGDEAAEALGGVDGGGGVLAADGFLAGEERGEDGLVFLGGGQVNGWVHGDLRAVVSCCGLVGLDEAADEVGKTPAIPLCRGFAPAMNGRREADGRFDHGLEVCNLLQCLAVIRFHT